LKIDKLSINESEIGFVDETREPGYRIFLGDTDIEVSNLSNQATENPARIELNGEFMGTGPTKLTTTFRPVHKTPEFDLALQIEATPLTAMNDLLLSYGKFDVVAGDFAFYTELHAHGGKLQGYVKPLFTNMDVYDRRQDERKPLFHELYEGIVGGIAALLENPNEDVATKADVSGRVDSPDVDTWQVVLRLIQNAFFRAIVPGFENSVKHE
jgi:hypothetical protein